MSFFSFATQAMTNTSPPIPALPGSTTFSTAATATAASIALPPFSRISTPMRLARFSCATTMPLRATTGSARAMLVMIGAGAGGATWACAAVTNATHAATPMI